MLCGLNAISTVCRGIGPMLRDGREAARRAVSAPSGVDLQFEERQERCAAAQEALLALLERLSMLREGKGRSAKLAERVLKSVQRCCGAG